MSENMLPLDGPMPLAVPLNLMVCGAGDNVDDNCCRPPTTIATKKTKRAQGSSKRHNWGRQSLKLQISHRTHKRFKYINRRRTMLIIFACVLPSLILTQIDCLDSPVKVQRFKQQVSANAVQQTPKGLEPQPTSSAGKIDRVRRTNPPAPTSHNASSPSSNNSKQPDECPPSKLIQSLLPVEYQPSSSTQQRGFCDCVKDLYGWYVTCFAGSSSSSASAGLATGSVSLPNQLHPAFRAPQLQRQQQAAAAAAAAHRRVHRSPNRWMGDESSVSNNNNNEQPPEDSSASHEGFGDEPTTVNPTLDEPAKRNRSKAPSRGANETVSQHANSSISFKNEDSFVLSPSSNSFTLLHPQDHFQPPATNNSNGGRMNEKLMMQQAGNNNNNNHLTFQTIPFLFRVKYLRNNMIEIDCDLAAPHYKPAMFQGFNVNEISSFTFNNCKLPNVPFSALLYRARAPAAAAAESSGQHQQPASSPAGGRLGQSQPLKPGRLRHQNFVRRRRQTNEGSPPPPPMASLDNEGFLDSHEPLQQPGGSGTTALPSASRPKWAPGLAGESRVRSLIVNLNTVVNQGTLISLLAGLDLLEELQLNYMQLNLTNFELPKDPLDSDQATTSSSLDTLVLATRSGGSSNSPSLLAPPQAATTSAATSQPQLAPAAGSALSTGSSPSTTSSTTTTTTTTTSTTAAPMQILLAASAASTQPPVWSSSGRSSPPISTTLVRSQTTGTVTAPLAVAATDQLMSPTQQPPITTTTTTTTAGTATTTATTGRPNSQKPAKQLANQRPVQQASVTKPTLGMVGAPRGLIYAQATNQASTQTTTPTSPISSLAPATSPVTPQQTTVPSVSVATVLNNNQQAQSNTQRQTTNPTTSQMTNQRQQQPQHGAHISIATSQAQTVSYSNQPPGQSRSQTHQQTTTTMTGGGNQQTPPTSSSLMPNNNQQQQLNPTRLHQSPSGWVQTSSLPQPQGGPVGSMLPATRLIASNDGATSESMTHPTSNNFGGLDNQATSVSPPLVSAMPWSSPTTVNGNQNQNQLNAPANTPYAAMLHSNGYGIRTPSTGPLPASLSQYNNNSPNTFRTTNNANGNTQTSTMTNAYQAFRGSSTNQFTQPVTTVATTTISGANRRQAQQQFPATPTTTQSGPSQPTMATSDGNSLQFVAAGSRLSSPAINQNRQRQQGTGQPMSSPTTISATNNGAGSNNQLYTASGISSATNNPANGDMMSVLGSSGGVESSSLGSGSSSGSAASSAFSDDEFEPSVEPPAAAGLRLQVRSKRQTGGEFSESELQEEFELSFGELLPNLRFLRLQSFIDISRAVGAKDSQQRTRPPPASNRRFRRQFQPDDLPEKDDGHMSDSESEAISSGAGGAESLLAEETSVHHNSVMAPPEQRAHQQSNSMVTSRTGIMDSVVAASPPTFNRNSSMEPDEEPLLRAASDHSPPVPVVDSHLELGSDESASDQHQQQQQFLRIKRFSQVLVKMFSKLGKLRNLQLDRNDIPYWPDQVLYDSRNSLSRLYLISNNIRLMGRNSLANLTELETLDLSLNQLRQLQGDLFRDLSGLRNFRACCNLFRRLPSRLFGQISYIKTSNSPGRQQHETSAIAVRANRLERLDFSKNPHLSQVSADLFAAGPQQPPAPISSLTFSNCALTDQLAGKSAKSLFASLPDLVSITLRGNKLRDLLSTNGLFAKNNKLQALNVSHNQLVSLSANLFNTNASQLSELQLEHNQIGQIPDQFLFNLRKLRRLSLAHNRLSHLGAFLFINNEQIEFIDLSHNQLVTLNTHLSQQMPFGTGQRLRHLNLAHNNLTQFKGDIFEINWIFYTHLNLLDLSHNKFEGQISMPIFHTIADEMLLNLASNQVQSVNVDDLRQHDEHPLDRYASNSAEGLAATDGPRHHTQLGGSQQQQTKVPTVNIRLTGNPIACDCLLEPLISYSRRVAAATNPTLEAHFFAPQKASHPDGSLPASSRYSVLSQSAGAAGPPASVDEHGGLDGGQASNSPGQQSGDSGQPPVFYQFKFNDLYCAKPSNLQRQLLSHVSISDLLCPIKDQRMCPKQCKCDYQSAFKTAFVDCDNQQLSRVPDQLTDASNFVQFNIEPSFWSSNPGTQSASNNNLTMPIASVDKVVIYLRNNRLRSMEQLAKLFTVATSSANQPERSRFARAPTARGSSVGPAKEEESRLANEPLNPNSGSLMAQPLTSSSFSEPPNGSQQLAAPSKKVVSPAMIGRSMLGSSNAGRQITSRYRRQADRNPSSGGESTAEGFDMASGINHLSFDSPTTTTTTTSSSLVDMAPISTAVLESAEEFRNKRYPMTCELHLDHNLIDSIPDSFLDQLDRWRSSAIHSTLTPPQAALPTMMQEPPIHTRLHHVGVADHGAAVSGNGPSSSTMSSVSEVGGPPAMQDGNMVSIDNDHDAGSEGPLGGNDHLFGRPPFTPERKAALMESINEKVRLNQMQRLQQPGVSQNDEAGTGKISVSPALGVLSLRFNNLANINHKILQRLSKIIMSSNTKFYLGHNPFNCTDNYALPTELETGTGRGAANGSGPDPQRPAMVPASPMGDQLMAASDASSGAYLESMADDLTPSASSADTQSVAAAALPLSGQPLAPVDCPVGQLKSWITRHRANVEDLDEIYCVRMSHELMEKLRIPTGNGSSIAIGDSQTDKQALDSMGSGNSLLDNHNPWTAGHNGSGLLEKEGLSWNSELFASAAKLVDMNVYDLCPYSGVQVLDPSASGLLSAGHQQALISVAIVFILISLCLLLMLIYFGDTQTILAFIYIHMNPIYSCLRLNESHLDGEKLYDAFVSYSSADRDIVMELIERLEQQPNLLIGGNGGFDFKSESIGGGDQQQVVTTNTNGAVGSINGTLNRRTNSFQDLSTMSRSTSRIMMGADEFGGSALEMDANRRSTSGQGATSDASKGAGGVVPYRLCIHERDWLPGHLISWNIVNSVQNSRRTILILSKEFIKSVWFQVEFHTAYYQMLEDKIDRLIVIVRGELPPKAELDKNLAFLLTTKTYLTWGEKWFWERLHYALPHRSVPPPSVKVASNTIKSKALNEPKHYHQAPTPKQHQQMSNSNKQQSADYAATLAGGHQRPLVMSSIGKDCSNLLLPVHHQQGPAMIGSSSSSSGSSASNTRSSGSYLSGSSTGNLLSPTGVANYSANHATTPPTQTTTNDLLSAAPNSTTAARGATTKLTIGPVGASHDPHNTDSGRVTGHLSSGSLTMSPLSPSSDPSASVGGVTSIMVDGGLQSGANSKVRAKKQERLQNFVDKSISSQFNLSEL